MPIDDPLWPTADRWLAAGHPRPELLVVGVPSSTASLTPSNAHLTPAQLRTRLGRFSTYQGEWDLDLAPVPVADLGDWPVEQLDMHQMPVEVEQRVASLPSAPLYLFIGGDNAVTRPLVRGLAAGSLGQAGVLTFDAHHDVRALDRGPTNGTPIRGLVQEDGLPGSHVAQVGIHSYANSRPYRRWCDEQGIAVFPMAAVDSWGVEDVTAAALDALDRVAEWIYVDIDLDVLDRAFAPACPGARPGGMTPRQLAAAARVVGRHPKVRAVDLVELDPERDRDGLTLDCAATVMLSVVAGFAERRAA